MHLTTLVFQGGTAPGASQQPPPGFAIAVNPLRDLNTYLYRTQVDGSYNVPNSPFPFKKRWRHNTYFTEHYLRTDLMQRIL